MGGGASTEIGVGHGTLNGQDGWSDPESQLGYLNVCGPAELVPCSWRSPVPFNWRTTTCAPYSTGSSGIMRRRTRAVPEWTRRRPPGDSGRSDGLCAVRLSGGRSRADNFYCQPGWWQLGLSLWRYWQVLASTASPTTTSTMQSTTLLGGSAIQISLTSPCWSARIARLRSSRSACSKQENVTT
jgi:hypothetical protein